MIGIIPKANALRAKKNRLFFFAVSDLFLVNHVSSSEIMTLIQVRTDVF